MFFSRVVVAGKTIETEKVKSSSLYVIAFGVVAAILYWGRMFFITSLIAVILAFILEPFVTLLMRSRMPRGLASFIVCCIAGFLLYLAGLGAYTQISGLIADLPRYGQRISEIVDSVRQRAESAEDSLTQLVVPSRRARPTEAGMQQDDNSRQKRRRNTPSPSVTTGPAPLPEVRIHEESSPIRDYIYNNFGSFSEVILMISFVPFLVYFMLSWRDHIHRSFLQFFQGEERAVAARSLQGIAEMVRAFVVGNFMLGVLLAVLSTLAFWLIHVPYPMLVGPLSGVLSLVPYVGLPLAMIPPIFTALPAFTGVGSYALLTAIVSVLHLAALNLLYPKLVGARVHLNPLVVTFSLMLWAFLWGGFGLVLAIPLTAAIKAVFDNVKELRPLGRFLGD